MGNSLIRPIQIYRYGRNHSSSAAKCTLSIRAVHEVDFKEMAEFQLYTALLEREARACSYRRQVEITQWTRKLKFLPVENIRENPAPPGSLSKVQQSYTKGRKHMHLGRSLSLMHWCYTDIVRPILLYAVVV